MSEEIIEFWNIDQSKLSKEQIKECIISYYGDAFINNYKVFKETVDAINESIIIHLNEIKVNKKYHKIFTFDEYCKKIIDVMCNWVDKNGYIIQRDLILINEIMLNEHLMLIIEKNDSDVIKKLEKTSKKTEDEINQTIATYNEQLTQKLIQAPVVSQITESTITQLMRSIKKPKGKRKTT